MSRRSRIEHAVARQGNDPGSQVPRGRALRTQHSTRGTRDVRDDASAELQSVIAGGRIGAGETVEALRRLLGMAPRAVIFDMDGVLADTEPINERAMAAVLARRDAHPSHEEYVSLIGMANDASLQWFIDRFGLDTSIEELAADYEREIVPRLAAEAVAAPGALSLLSSLLGSGVRLAVASSSPRRAVDALLAAIGVAAMFDVVVSGEEVENGKPAPDIFLRASRDLEVEPGDCVVIEDSPFGIEAARRAGMVAVALRTQYTSGVSVAADLVIDSLERLIGGGDDDSHTSGVGGSV